jgi:hypothetical protein
MAVSKTGGPRDVLGWAVYLGCSWTWCIGMFLPVLLVRDLGWWGWVVFAVPNVIGAAAFGWVIKSPRASREITSAHGLACSVFSVVTIVFHLFFCAWMLPRLLLPLPNLIPVAGGAALAGLAVYRIIGPRGSAVFALAISLAAMGVVIQGGVELPHRLGELKAGPLDWLGIGIVSVFGFFLCPYLDITFHHARQSLESPVRSRVAFGVGFGVIFLVMIVFTLLYARIVAPLLWMDDARWIGRPRAIGIHILAQTIFTILAHADRLRQMFAAAILMAVGLVDWRGPIFQAYTTGNLTGGEGIYRLLMGFYGLVFPAYVLLCMIPLDRPITSVRSVVLAGACVVLAAPAFWIGYIQPQFSALLLGVAVLLAGRLVMNLRFSR